MSETKWIPYDEKKDERPNVPRPKVKHIKIYKNYPLSQFYSILQVFLIGATGWFLNLTVQSTLAEPPSSPITAQTEIFMLKLMFCIVGVFICSFFYEQTVTREEFIEDLQ